MKKNLMYAMMSAIALTGSIGFSACQSSDEIIDNPDYNPETNSVKTEFVINVTQPGERTRQTSDIAGNGNFQGINNMQLICLTNVPGTDNSITSEKKLALTSFTETPSLDNSEEKVTNTSSQVYTLYIPVETSNFLFYATALSSTTGNEFAQGVLNNNLSSASVVSGNTETPISFSLQSIVSTATEVTDVQSKLAAILNGIAGAGITGTDVKTWASTYSSTDEYKALGEAYNMFTNQANNPDVRQGSSKAILHMVEDLFGVVNGIYSETSNSEAVRKLAKAVLDKIAEHFTVTTSGSDLSTTYSWDTTGSYKEDTDGATFNSNPYPESQNLPDGSAVVKHENNTFSYVNDGTMGGTSAVSTAYNNFTYPAQLTYYCNSGLWQTTTSKTSSSYPTTSSEWVKESSWSDWTASKVTSATRAVAMKDNITYGVAQLASNIKLNGTSFTDNANSVTKGITANQTFTDIKLKLHGMLIGGQPDAAQFEYLPQSNAISKVIYDKISEIELSTNDTKNYTLVLDNFVSGDGATQSTVNVALEMTANKDFYGVSGKIKAGQKFYLIGSLDPNSPTSGSTIDWTKHTSFESGDTGYGTNRVFIRDAKTEATFTLNNTCLQKAYSTIPDLRSTQMLFGISVDLAWKAGLSFNVNIG